MIGNFLAKVSMLETNYLFDFKQIKSKSFHKLWRKLVRRKLETFSHFGFIILPFLIFPSLIRADITFMQSPQ